MGLAQAKLLNRLLRARLGRKPLAPLAQANLRALDHLRANAPAWSQDYVVADLETTGLDPSRDRVVSLAALRLRQGRIQLGQRFESLVSPGRDLPVKAIQVHGITPQSLEQAPPLAQVLADFLAFLGPGILVLHYAPFDLAMLAGPLRGLLGFGLQNLVLDTVRLCRGALLPDHAEGQDGLEGLCALEALARRFGLPQEGRHTALGDALLTALVLQRLLARLAQRGLGSLGRVASLGAQG